MNNLIPNLVNVHWANPPMVQTPDHMDHPNPDDNSLWVTTIGKVYLDTPPHRGEPLEKFPPPPLSIHTPTGREPPCREEPDATTPGEQKLRESLSKKLHAVKKVGEYLGKIWLMGADTQTPPMHYYGTGGKRGSPSLNSLPHAYGHMGGR